MEQEIEKLKNEYAGLQKLLASPEVISDYKKFQETAKRVSVIEKILTAEQDVEKLRHEIKELREISQLNDIDLAAMANEDLVKKEK